MQHREGWGGESGGGYAWGGGVMENMGYLYFLLSVSGNLKLL